MTHRTQCISLLSAALILLPIAAHAEGLPNPLGSADTITDVIVNVSRALIGLVAIGATFMFVYGGVMMLTSAGNADQVKKAKDVLRWTTIGLVILFFAGAIMRYIYSVLGPEEFEDISGSIGLGQGSLTVTVVNTLNAVIGLLGIVAVTFIIWSGYQWLTAGGNEQRIEKAKGILTAAVTGLVIILLSWAIVNFVLRTGTNVAQ